MCPCECHVKSDCCFLCENDYAHLCTALIIDEYDEYLDDDPKSWNSYRQ